MSYARIQRGRMAADVVARGFTQISNDLFRDPRLSGLAMGVFGHISTHRDGYGITPESIARHMRNGVSAIKKALRELERCGYLARTQTRNADGTMGPSIYRITDMPDGLAIVEAAPYPESPRSGPSDENQPPAVTCENKSSPRSEPSVENPPADSPPAENCATKNTSHKNTSEQNTNRQNTSPPRSVRSAQVGDARARATAPQAASEDPKGSDSSKGGSVRPSGRPQGADGAPVDQRGVPVADRPSGRGSASRDARRVLGALPRVFRDGAKPWALAEMAVRIDAMLTDGHSPGAIVGAAEEIAVARPVGDRDHIAALRAVRAALRANAFDRQADDVADRCDGCGARRTGTLPCVTCDPVEVIDVIDLDDIDEGQADAV